MTDEDAKWQNRLERLQARRQGLPEPPLLVTAFDKYDAEAIVDALEDAFESLGMWDSYSDWQRAKGIILSEWKRSGGKSRLAFDKRNVPELLTALEGLLTKKGLNKALNALERVKRGILREWKTIGVEALREQKHNRKPTFEHGPDLRPHLGATMRHPMAIYQDSLRVKTATVGPYALVDKRAVTFWDLVPIHGIRNQQSHAVIKGLQESDKALENIVRRALRANTPESHVIGASVQMGHIVQPSKSGHSIVVYTQFWKEGEDRTRDEIDTMERFLNGLLGIAISHPPIPL